MHAPAEALLTPDDAAILRRVHLQPEVRYGLWLQDEADAHLMARLSKRPRVSPWTGALTRRQAA